MALSVKFANINTGDSLPPFTSSPITRTDLVRYATEPVDFDDGEHTR
jgi:hypothetical protein